MDCLLPDGTVSQITYNECVQAGGRALTQDELNQLRLDRDNLINELGYLSGLQFNSNVITSLKHPDSSSTIETAVETKGKRYGFYGSYKKIKEDIPGNNYGDDPGIDEVEKGGIIKKKK